MTKALAATVLFLFAGASGFGSDAHPSPRPPRTVAFVLTNGANVMDFAGPWEVFQDVQDPQTGENSFRLYTVSDAREPVGMTGGLRVAPEYVFGDAPAPDIVVVGAQKGSPAMLEWLKRTSVTATVMSVCTGAFKLAQAGLLDGLPATTHHEFFEKMEKEYPKVKLQKGLRWVQASDRLYSAGGLTSGIDLALHLVARLAGEAAADRTAFYMEHSGNGWRVPTATPVRAAK